MPSKTQRSLSHQKLAERIHSWRDKLDRNNVILGGHAPQLTGFVFPALVPHCMCDIDNDECREDRFSQHYCYAHRVLEHSWNFWLTGIAVILFCRSEMASDGTLFQAHIRFPQELTSSSRQAAAMNFDMQQLSDSCDQYSFYHPGFLDECLGTCKREQPEAWLLILTKACQSADLCSAKDSNKRDITFMMNRLELLLVNKLPAVHWGPLSCWTLHCCRSCCC